MKLEDITVIDGVNNNSFRFDEGSSGGRRNYLESTRAWEQEASWKLLQLVRVAYPQAEVAVHSQILLADIMEVETDPGKPVSTDTYVESDETSTPVRSGSGGQTPGFASNSGVNGPVAIGGGRGGPQDGGRELKAALDAVLAAALLARLFDRPLVGGEEAHPPITAHVHGLAHLARLQQLRHDAPARG